MTSAIDNQRTPTVEQIEDQAAHFLTRRRFADWQSSDQAELDAWLAASLSHRVAFWRLEATLARTQRLAALHARNVPASTSLSDRIRFKLRFATALGAMAAIAAITGIYFSSPSQTMYSTPVGGHEVLKLADGSVIELNTDTVLRLKAGGRAAVLERGEAYFEIKHNAAQPFTVETSRRRIIDVGTKFLIRNDASGFAVSLVEGLARVEPLQTRDHATSTLLRPGDVAMDQGGSIRIRRRPATLIARELGWRRGMLVFDNTTLAQAATEFNRYNQTKLLIADHTAGQLVIGATFPANDVERFARSARVLLGVTITRRGRDIVISR